MSGRDARPRSPERLHLMGVKVAGGHTGDLRLVVEVSYDPWCCTDGHEMSDAVLTITRVIEDAIEKAASERSTALDAGETAPSYPAERD